MEDRLHIRKSPKASPWEIRREVLNAEWFVSIDQAETVIGSWLNQYNHIRPHQALNMHPPVLETPAKIGA